MIEDCDWSRARREIEIGTPMRRAPWPTDDRTVRGADGEVTRHHGDGSPPQIYLPTLGDTMAEDWESWG